MHALVHAEVLQHSCLHVIPERLLSPGEVAEANLEPACLSAASAHAG